MQKLIHFWKQDIINKLIVLVTLALVTGVSVIAFIIVRMPEDRSLGNAFGEIFPSATPTLDMGALLTRSAFTAAPKTASAVPTFFMPSFTPSAPPTPFTPAPPSLTPTITSTPIPLATLMALRATPRAAMTATAPTVQAGQSAPTQRPALPASSDAGCVPTNPARAGKVVEILDGITIRVLMADDGLVYVVRYLGVAVPSEKPHNEAAKQKNFELAYGRQVVLTPDSAPKDDRGRLLYYAMTGDETFVNLELIKQGYGSALDTPPNLSCAQAFISAEESARASQLGIWSVPNP